MVIVAAHLVVEPRSAHGTWLVARTVRSARGTTGCLEFAITADLLDPARIVILERWKSQRR